MFTSKFFLIMAVVTLLLIGAGLYFQFAEGQSYGLIQTIQEQILGGGANAK